MQEEIEKGLYQLVAAIVADTIEALVILNGIDREQQPYLVKAAQNIVIADFRDVIEIIHEDEDSFNTLNE